MGTIRNRRPWRRSPTPSRYVVAVGVAMERFIYMYVSSTFIHLHSCCIYMKKMPKNVCFAVLFLFSLFHAQLLYTTAILPLHHSDSLKMRSRMTTWHHLCPPPHPGEGMCPRHQGPRDHLEKREGRQGALLKRSHQKGPRVNKIRECMHFDYANCVFVIIMYRCMLLYRCRSMQAVCRVHANSIYKGINIEKKKKVSTAKKHARGPDTQKAVGRMHWQLTQKTCWSLKNMNDCVIDNTLHHPQRAPP